MHFPFWQVPPVQAVPSVLFTFAGQVAAVPRQFSAASHSPTEALQTVEDKLKTLAGQAAELPVHFSAESHTPTEALQIVV